eukprot:PLAT2564.2.p1 GENE.PLAT2564.2~~PLAT2564.2.p1  ORF type:complete len:374 (-),score=175.26 PLAT2564.2:336-1457(-)
MPHANVLYPFVEESEFEAVLPALAEALRSVAPFSVRAERTEFFRHSKSITWWLSPQREAEEWQALHTALTAVLPQCKEDRPFVPHISLGQFKTARAHRAAAAKFEESWEAIDMDVGHLSLISRESYSDVFRERFRLHLGTGTVEAMDGLPPPLMDGEGGSVGFFAYDKLLHRDELQVKMGVHHRHAFDASLPGSVLCFNRRGGQPNLMHEGDDALLLRAEGEEAESKEEGELAGEAAEAFTFPATGIFYMLPPLQWEKLREQAELRDSVVEEVEVQLGSGPKTESAFVFVAPRHQLIAPNLPADFETVRTMRRAAEEHGWSELLAALTALPTAKKKSAAHQKLLFPKKKKGKKSKKRRGKKKAMSEDAADREA